MKRTLPFLLLPLLAGCAVFGKSGPEGIEDLTVDTAAAQLVRADEERAAGRTIDAIERLVAIRDLERLGPDERRRCEELLDVTVRAWIDLLDDEPDGAELLLDLYDMDLPPRLRARAAVRAARAQADQGDNVDSWRTIQQLENDLPNHTERGYAADVLAEAGFALIANPERYGLFNLYRYRTRGLEALEFLVLNYPSQPRCPEAYAALASTYEQRGNLDEAILRHEDLLLYHSNSPYAVASEARMPFLRMERLEQDDYDRKDLEQALRDLTGWIGRHGGDELEPEVRELLALCHLRLSRNDMIVARFYERVGNPFGARLHAERALEEARSAGAEGQQRKVLAFLEGLPEEGAQKRAERGAEEATDDVPEVGRE
jgi:outer membrane protein assembly factor BamD (BamD/ComL family)